MKLRTRIAVIASMVLMLIGIGSAANAGPSAANLNHATTATNGCVLLESVQLGLCLNRL